MATTLKLGNSKWATKDGSLLAYNDENGNFKPLPFNFTRDTGGTVVNKDGLIEVVSNNVPRIDFSNDANGALLLEPQRSNLITYSEDFSDASWNKSNVNVTSNTDISPRGDITSDSLIKNTTGVDGSVTKIISATATGYVGSIFVKKDTNTSRFPEFFVRSSVDLGENEIYVQLNTSSGETAIRLQNGTVSVSTPILVNNYWRISFYTLANSNNCRFGIRPAASTTLGGYDTNATGSIIVWGAQLEEGSYATSYIPTNGSAVTRVAESTSQTPPSGIIRQTEGSVYVEGNVILDSNGSMPFTIYLNSSNILYAWFRTNGIIDIDVFASGLFQDRIRTSVGTISNGDYFKLSVGYKSNDLVAYLNGVIIGTASPPLIPSCSSLILGGYIATDYTGSLINKAQLYDTRLSNAELQALTS